MNVGSWGFMEREYSQKVFVKGNLTSWCSFAEDRESPAVVGTKDQEQVSFKASPD